MERLTTAILGSKPHIRLMTQVPIILMKTDASGIVYIILHYSYQMDFSLK